MKKGAAKRYFAEIHSRQFYIDLLLMTLSSLVWALAFNCLIRPNGFLSGGFTGVALIIDYFVPISIGLAVFIMNVPALIWSLKELNKRFMIYTIYCVVLQSLLFDLTAGVPAYSGDPMLAAIFAGLMGGIAGGVIIRQRGSSGGLDIIGIIVKKKFGFSVGTVGNIFNITLILLSSLLFNVEMAMYTIIYILCSNFAVDKTIEGLSKKYTAMILSGKPDEIKQAIYENTYRGLTFLKGEGAFSGTEKTVIYCVLNQFDLAILKDVLYKIDPDVMVTLTESIDIFDRIHQKGRPKQQG